MIGIVDKRKVHRTSTHNEIADKETAYRGQDVLAMMTYLYNQATESSLSKLDTWLQRIVM